MVEQAFLSDLVLRLSCTNVDCRCTFRSTPLHTLQCPNSGLTDNPNTTLPCLDCANLNGTCTSCIER